MEENQKKEDRRKKEMTGRQRGRRRR